MNVVQGLARRRAGYESQTRYDIALYRLQCHQYDIYRGIEPFGSPPPEWSPDPPVLACRFCTTPGYNNILALANEDGKFAIQDTNKIGHPNQQFEGTQAHCNAVFDVCWMPGELKLVTVSGDHTARLWDTTRSDHQGIGCYIGHTRSVKTAAFRPQDKAVFATGARDGAIMVWDIRASRGIGSKPDNCILNGHGQPFPNVAKQRRRQRTASRAQSITALTFQDDFSLVSCAAGDGLIKVWDMRKNYTVHKKEPVPKHVMHYTGGSIRHGFTTLLSSPDGTSLYASCMDGIIYEYNISSYDPKPFAEFYGHRNSTFYIKTCLSPDGEYLASGSSDEYAYIWSTKRPGCPVVKLWGHTDEVTCITWCNSREPKIVTCSDDCTHRVWRIGLEHKAENEEVEIRGRAERVDVVNPVERVKLETTPTVSRRWFSHQEETPVSDTTPVTTPDPSGNGRPNYNPNVEPARGTKRSCLHMAGGGPWTDGKFKSVLSPVVENLEPKAKRPHLDRGARRLFSPISERHEAPSLPNGYESDEPVASCSNATDYEKSRQMPFSPTLNLPNYVVDGTAPHLVQMSPQKCKENIDWLTKIRKERYELRIGKVETEKSTTNGQTTPARRTSRSRSMEPRKIPKNPAVSLLNFFRISTKDLDKDRCGADINDATGTSTTITPTRRSSIFENVEEQKIINVNEINKEV